VLYAFSGIRVIQPQETALVRRLGRLQPQQHGPGLLIGLPSPFDEVLRFDTGRDLSLPLDDWSLVGGKIGDPDKPIEKTDAQLYQEIHSKEIQPNVAKFEYTTLDPVRHGYTLTSDYHVIQGRFTLRYRITDPFAHASAGTQLHTLLGQLARRSLAIQLAARDIDSSLTTGRSELAEKAAADMQSAATALQLGIRVSGIDVIQLSPPRQVLMAFEDVVNARQFAKTLAENSRMYHSETITKAEGDAAAILQRGQAFSAELKATAQGEAAAFTAVLENYQRQPELVARRFLRDSLDAVMGQIYSRTLLPVENSTPTILVEPSPQFSR
jgi:membrane protease subunit HflK